MKTENDKKDDNDDDNDDRSPLTFNPLTFHLSPFTLHLSPFTFNLSPLTVPQYDSRNKAKGSRL